jgi:hypothetical protein
MKKGLLSKKWEIIYNSLLNKKPNETLNVNETSTLCKLTLQITGALHLLPPVGAANSVAGKKAGH